MQIRGNIFWNGPPSLPLGTGDSACLPSNTACNEQQLLAENRFNTLQPQLVNPAGGNFRPITGIPALASPFASTLGLI